MQWQFSDLSQSTGAILLAILALWSIVASIICWALVSGATSMREDVKFKFVADDQPLSRQRQV